MIKDLINILNTDPVSQLRPTGIPHQLSELILNPDDAEGVFYTTLDRVGIKSLISAISEVGYICRVDNNPQYGWVLIIERKESKYKFKVQIDRTSYYQVLGFDPLDDLIDEDEWNE